MKINKILVVVLAIFIPFILLMAGVRLVMTPAFPALEYKRSGFPQDLYGFTIQDRTKWSDYAVSYLTNDQGIEYLGNLQDETGQKMFMPDELSHMEDVKLVVTTASTVWYVLGGLSIAIFIWFVIMRQWESIRKVLNAGGWLTIGLLGALLVFLAVSFDKLFEYFHRLLFQDGTWTFSQSSTLIRLFPFEFWRDAFILVIGLAFLIGFFLVLMTQKRKKRSKA
ncbi:MAG TPA: TIGR01906 family membrane protein [Anaerolineaceae bacterium]|nr:TIGR01906 family membrane protein [Anaerolineaceae bacterium]